MKKTMVLAAAVVAASVFAQDQRLTPYQAALRAGVAFPMNNDLGGTFWGLGFDYTLEASLFRTGQTYLSVDWITKSTNSNRNNLYTFALNQRFFLGDSAGESALRTYAFAGLGLGIIDVNRSATVLAGRVGLGAEFSSNVFGELSLQLTSKAKNTETQANLFGIHIGYRF